MKPKQMKLLGTLFIVLTLVLPNASYAVRIKDIATANGVRSNQLIGYGLVVGLDGSGDQTTQTPFTIQSLKSMLSQLGVNVPDNVNPQLKNVAAVMVTAELPPFAKPGQSIDVTVSSMGNSKSLRGGSLLMTPLKAANGKTYALAQGSMVVGGFGANGADGSSVTVNIPSSGRIPNGAIVERGVLSPFGTDPVIIMNLNVADFSTAQRVAASINATMGEDTARPMDAVSVEVRAPAAVADKVAFMSVLENIEVDPGSAAAKVIINSRTGTVVIGNEVRVERAAVTHGNITVTISEDILVSQPNAFGEGNTAVVPNSDVAIEQEESRLFVLEPGITLQELVTAINRVGAAPGDLIAILEALQQAGALHARLIVI